ncbi:hypothetical protein J3R82DRAFT_7039 [Butyriboletus roseoflavus]|nr:hypothetical protein J3R82DRAFT_7039 [Butyriboletus roseoflavus]
MQGYFVDSFSISGWFETDPGDLDYGYQLAFKRRHVLNIQRLRLNCKTNQSESVRGRRDRETKSESCCYTKHRYSLPVVAGSYKGWSGSTATGQFCFVTVNFIDISFSFDEPIFMATWLVGHTPWLLPARARLHLEFLPSRLWLQARSHLNVALQTPSPASLEIETMPYPTGHPDASVFEPMSEEYTSVFTAGPHHFTPLSSSETLASLVLKGNFQAAESLRKEMISHHIPIPCNALYLRAALHAITEVRPRGSAKERLDAFEAWLSLAPDRHEEGQSFHDIRQRLFRFMDHLNLTLVYRFGLVLASKGYYSGKAAMQVVSTLARYTRLSVVERYLLEVEDASRDYLSKKGTVPPSELLAGAYNVAIRTVALAGKHEAAHYLISMAQPRRVHISSFTLEIVAKHAPDRQMATDRIRGMYPPRILQNTSTPSVSVKCKTIPAENSADIAVLAARLRSLRIALRSPFQPSPHALRSFVISYRALGRTRALVLLRSLAYRHSPKSASTWAFTKMHHHHSRREPIHVLSIFSQHFHLVGVPRRTLLSFIRGTRGQQPRKERVRRWVTHPLPKSQKLWPTAYHTALVWEAIVLLSPSIERERLYTLLLSLVRRSKQQEVGLDGPGSRQIPEADQPRLQLPPDTYDNVHFSSFVSWWARRNPARATSVLQDMVDLGVEPSMIQWSLVARGYAQHDDPLVALRILDCLEDVERGREDNAGIDDGDAAAKGMCPSDVLLGAHTNVLRGFVIAGDVQHAREVEGRLVARLGYQAGQRRVTDANIALLRGLEDKLERSPS